MKINNINDIKKSHIRIFSLQTQDIFFVLYHDLPSFYLLSLLIDRLWFELEQFSIQYVYPFKNYFDYISPKIEHFKEEYFIFFLENYFHSSDYAYNFLIKVLKFMKDNNINKKIIIHSLKTPEINIKQLFRDFDNILLFINTDIEYFFNEFFYKKTDILDIANIYFRDDDWNLHITKNESVNYDLWEYILWWYYNNYFFNFQKSVDELIYIKINEKKKIVNDNIFHSRSNEKYINTLKKLKNDTIMLQTWRWCKFNCTYCYRGIKYSKVRQIPLDVIKKDLDTMQQFWYTSVYLYDDCFVSTNSDRLDELLELFSHYNFSYQIAARYEVLDEINLEKLSKANINIIQVWLQSTSKNTNINSNRNLDLNNFNSAIQNMKKRWINISIDLILWLPWDTLKDFIQTLNFAINLRPSSIFINKLFLNPKTELFENKEKYWIITENNIWLNKDFYVSKILYSNTFWEKDLLIAEKLILWLIAKFSDISIILR